MSIFNKVKDILQKSYDYVTYVNNKEWTKRRFQFYLIFGDLPENKCPWIKTEWNENYEPLIRQILQHSTEFNNTGIRVLEYKKKNLNLDYYSELKLGRLRWNDKSHQKWTIQVSDEIKFNRFESWTPIWTICDKTNSAPDIYISIQNEEDSRIRFKELLFNPFVVIAIADDMKFNCDSIIVDFSKKINAKKTICRTRSWSNETTIFNKNGWSFYNWIQHTYSNGIYKGQSLHGFTLDEIVFEPFWEIIYKRIN